MSDLLGKKAPSFTLMDQNGEKVSLKDYLGKIVVVYFYPKAMTSGCTVQAQGIRDYAKEWKKRDVVVLAISPDACSKLKKFEEKENLNFILLSDEENEVSTKFNSYGKKKLYGKEYMGVLRQTFVIDDKGKIIHVMDKVKTKSHHDDLLKFIDSL